MKVKYKQYILSVCFVEPIGREHSTTVTDFYFHFVKKYLQIEIWVISMPFNHTLIQYTCTISLLWYHSKSLSNREQLRYKCKYHKGKSKNLTLKLNTEGITINLKNKLSIILN